MVILPHTWNIGILEYWNADLWNYFSTNEYFSLLCQDKCCQYPTTPFFQNPWSRPFTHRFRFTMTKFENAANNILHQLSRTRAGHYYIIPLFLRQYAGWVKRTKGSRKNNLAFIRSYPQPEGCTYLADNKGNKIGDNQIKGDGKPGPFPRTFPPDHNDGHNTGNV